jgi:hypothetical protein
MAPRWHREWHERAGASSEHMEELIHALLESGNHQIIDQRLSSFEHHIQQAHNCMFLGYRNLPEGRQFFYITAPTRFPALVSVLPIITTLSRRVDARRKCQLFKHHAITERKETHSQECYGVFLPHVQGEAGGEMQARNG